MSDGRKEGMENGKGERKKSYEDKTKRKVYEIGVERFDRPERSRQ